MFSARRRQGREVDATSATICRRNVPWEVKGERVRLVKTRRRKRSAPGIIVPAELSGEGEGRREIDRNRESRMYMET
jgi:hypothetical protein